MKEYNIKIEDITASNEAYYIENGKQSDRDLFDLDSDAEITFDEYMYIKAVYEAAQQELARRAIKINI